MVELAPKIKEALALLYERPEFKSLEKWNEIKRLEAAEHMLKVDMNTLGSERRIAFLQGQAYAHEYMLKELKKIHKDITTKINEG